MTFWQMLWLNFGYLGIQFGWALQLANMSGIYGFLGTSESNLGYLWIAAPLTGMIIQPIIGQISDRTTCKLGKRRPYVIIGTLMSFFTLLLMPNSTSVFMAVLSLIILDTGLNIVSHPYSALIADVAPASYYTKCYALQTIIVGIGAISAYILPWCFIHVFNLQESVNKNIIPQSLKLSFYIGAGVLLLTNLTTVAFVKEKRLTRIKKRSFSISYKWIKNFFIELSNMPKIIQQISLVQFFSWVGLFFIFLFFAPGIAQNIFNFPIGSTIDNNPIHAASLEQGTHLCGICSAIYSFISVLYSFFIPFLSEIFSRRFVHSISLLIGAFSMITCGFIHSKTWLFMTMIGLGMTWASVLTIPYAVMADNAPKNKIGLYMGLFNITTCLPQIVASFFSGVILNKIFHDRAMFMLSLAGMFFAFAGCYTFMIKDKNISTHQFSNI